MYRLTHAIGGLCGLAARMNASQEIRAIILMPLKTSHPPPGGRRRLVEVCRLVLGNRRSHAVPSASASNCSSCTTTHTSQLARGARPTTGFSAKRIDPNRTELVE
ncbi:hypothetical protein GW17_00021243 [Ensete ventricosum]|nr:hypothetical protein GW17_00021243 [Ensete ventricosum]